MTAETTNMVSLLSNLKSAVKNQVNTGGTLSSIKLVKTGPVRNPAVYPFISVLPIEERPGQLMNGVIDNIRRVRIEVYSKKSDSKSSMRASSGIIEKVKDIFKVNAADWQIPDRSGDLSTTVYDTQMTDINPGDNTIPYRNGFISMSFLELDCYSRDLLHPDVGGTTFPQVLSTDTKTLLDTITAVFKSYKTGAIDIFSSVRSFKSFTLPPQAKYPVIFIGITGHGRSHVFTGRDQVDRDISIYILHKLADVETALIRNLTLADYARQVMFANKDFSGRVSNLQYQGLVYGQLTSGAELLYGSSLQFVAQSIEDLVTA